LPIVCATPVPNAKDEVEERGPDDRLARRQHARGDDGRDRIRGVVKAVEEVEDQRHRDDGEDDAEVNGDAGRGGVGRGRGGGGEQGGHHLRFAILDLRLKRNATAERDVRRAVLQSQIANRQSQTHYPFFSTIRSIVFPTSSQPSIAFST
jgi:hypothetical protein